MSTKIYDAYMLNGEYTLTTLNEFLMKLREEITQVCEQEILDRVIRKTLYYYNFKQLHGDKVIRKMIEQTSDDKNHIHDIWKYVNLNDWNGVFLHNYFRIIDSITDKQNFRNDLHAKLQIIPMDDKILVMFFGDPNIRNYLENKTNYFSDYHYQNQCDKPESISNEEWEKRCFDWDKAIGPDYIPSHHGWSVELFDAENTIPVFSLEKSNKELHFPSESESLQELRDTLTSISSVTGYPSDSQSYSEWMHFTQSEPYKKWVNEANALIESKCNFITNKDDFIHLLKKDKVE